MKKYVNNSDMRQYVQKCQPFVNNNKTVWGDLRENKYDKWFTVYSYGPHFPMYICDMNTGEWYGTLDRFSRTTSQHQSKTHPLCEVKYLPLEQMKEMHHSGPNTYVMQEIADAAGI